MQIVMKLSLLLNCVYLLILTIFLNAIHSQILLPICSIPGLSTSRFCAYIHSASATRSSPISSHILCWLPGASGYSSCNSSDTSDKNSRLTMAVREEFHRLLALHKSTEDTPEIIADIREAVYAIDDLIILVRNSDIKNRDVVVESLKAITVAGKQSNTALQAYAARVTSAVKMYVFYTFLYLVFHFHMDPSITASVSHTVRVINSDDSLTGKALSLLRVVSPFYPPKDPTQGTFLRSLVIIQSSINILSQYNAETANSVVTLEQLIRGVVDLIGDESHEVTKEIGELLGRLWTKLGGNRSLLAQMNSRAHALSTVGRHSGAMRRFVGNVHQALVGLQESTDILRDIATAPLLLDGTIPRPVILAQLSDGCQALRESLMSSRAQGAFPTLHSVA